MRVAAASLRGTTTTTTTTTTTQPSSSSSPPPRRLHFRSGAHVAARSAPSFQIHRQTKSSSISVVLEEHEKKRFERRTKSGGIHLRRSTMANSRVACDAERVDDDAVELVLLLRDMISNRHKFPELRKTCVRFFEQKMAEHHHQDERKYSIPPKICLDCVEMLEDERRRREQEQEQEQSSSANKYTNCDDADEAIAFAPSLKEIESERVLLQFVIIESCSRTNGVREAYVRNWFELKNITRARLKCEKNRRRAANLVYFAAKERGGGAQQARVIARIAESFGVGKDDFLWGEEVNDIVTDRILQDYVHYLLEIAPGSACSMITHFELDAFTDSDTFELLANRDEIGLLEELTKNLSREKKIEFVATCLAMDRHSYLRAGFRTVKRFNLYEEFPDIKKQYWESSIDRMVTKGAFEAALKHAGDEVHFQERVVNALVAAGELEYARTFAERCSFSEADIASICSDEMMMQMRADRELRYYKLPENVNVSFVDDENSLKEMFEVLRTSTSIGIDTEWAAKLGDGLDSENESEETNDTEEDDAKMPLSKTARSTSNSLSETVALLQISSRTDCFLLDLPRLIHDVPSNVLEDTLGALFSNDSILKLVFAGKEDFKRLNRCASYLGQPRNVLDLQQYWRTRIENARKNKQNKKKNSSTAEGKDDDAETETRKKPWLREEELNRHQPIGLSNLCAALLSKPLDKAARMSDWSLRPLSESQTAYAALDAQVLVQCHDVLVKETTSLDEPECAPRRF